MDGQKGKQLRSRATPMGHTKDVGPPPSAWMLFRSTPTPTPPPRVCMTLTLKLTGGTTEDGVSEHGRLLGVRSKSAQF